MATNKKIEYRVREVTRFIVTRYEEEEGINGKCSAGSSTLGEYTSEDTAYAVGYALAKEEHRRLGWPIGDERIQYPLPVRKPARPVALSVTEDGESITATVTDGSLGLIGASTIGLCSRE